MNIQGSQAANNLFIKKLLFLSLSGCTLRSSRGNSVTSQSRYFLEIATTSLTWTLRPQENSSDRAAASEGKNFLQYLGLSPRREKPNKKQNQEGKARWIPIRIWYRFSRERNHHSNKLLRATVDFPAPEVFKSRPDLFWRVNYTTPLRKNRL